MLGTFAYVNKCETATADKANCRSLSRKVDTRQLSESPSKTLLLINMNTIQQLALEKSIPLHVNSPAIARYPWQTGILKANDLDDIFKSTNLKVKALSLFTTPSNYLYSIGFFTKTRLI